jgi:heat shock protein HslJ
VKRSLSVYISMIVLLMALLPLVGCAFLPAGDPLDGTSWTLSSLHGKPPLVGTHPSLRFSHGYVSGSTGCNEFLGADEGGKYKITKNGGLTIGNFVQTVMACTTPEGVMDQEGAYRAALFSAAAFRLVDDRLEIQDAQGETILVFTR